MKTRPSSVMENIASFLLRQEVVNKIFQESEVN